MNTGLKLHLGCGPILLDGWINIDLDSPEADMLLDLRQPLPFTDGSVSHVFSEHVIEHIEREEALSLLREIRRVLDPGGVVRLTTPDLAWLVVNYVSGLTDGWGNLWQPGTPARLLNEGLRSWGHRFVYDRPEFLRLLTEAGFEDVSFVEWRESVDPVLNGIESRPFNREIVVEARIPFRAHPEHASQLFITGYEGMVEDRLAAQRRELDEACSSRRQVEEAAEIDRLTSRLAEVEELHRNAQDDIGRLEGQLADAEMRIVQRDQRFAEMEQRLDETRQRLVETQQRHIEAEQRLEAERATVQLTAEIARLRDIVEERGGAIQRVEAHAHEISRESALREVHIKTLEDALRREEAAVLERDRKMDSLSRSLFGKLLFKLAKSNGSI